MITDDDLVKEFVLLTTEPAVDPMVLSIALAGWYNMSPTFADALRGHGVDVNDDLAVLVGSVRIKPITSAVCCFV